MRRHLAGSQNKLLILYCACTHEEDAGDVAMQLIHKFQYKDIRLLEGGWTEWLKLGYPIEKQGEMKVFFGSLQWWSRMNPDIVLPLPGQACFQSLAIAGYWKFKKEGSDHSLDRESLPG